MDKLVVCAPIFSPDGTTAEDVISADDNVLSTEPLLTDDEIIDDTMDDETVEDAMNGDDDDASREPICPKASDVRNALEVLREYMLFSTLGGEIQRNINKITGIVEDELTSEKLKQRDIRTFFQ